MSRQSKNARNKIIAKQFSEIRKSGGSGPARTTPAHGKIHTLWAERRRKAEAVRIAAAEVKSNKPATKGNGSKYAQKQGQKKAA